MRIFVMEWNRKTIPLASNSFFCISQSDCIKKNLQAKKKTRFEAKLTTPIQKNRWPIHGHPINSGCPMV